MDSDAKIEIVKDGLRIKYAGDLTGLRRLFTEVMAGATKFVEITGTSFEGGSAQGVQIFDRIEYLAAVKAVLREMDSTLPAPPPAGALAHFGYSPLQT
jgi:hypothetical protein